MAGGTSDEAYGLYVGGTENTIMPDTLQLKQLTKFFIKLQVIIAKKT